LGNPNPTHQEVVLYDRGLRKWLHFRSPLQVLEVRDPADIRPTLRSLEAEVENRGLWAAGFLSYEASRAFDPACVTLPETDFPLLWFGLYEKPDIIDLPPTTGDLRRPHWSPAITLQSFTENIRAIKDHIARGESYQVNVTFPLHADFQQDPWPFFRHLVHGQKAGYAAYIDTGRWAVCSASPELFFERNGRHVLTRPMKGTAPRGRTLCEDRIQAETLCSSEKNRAENLMILDMIRNDLGRLGSAVQVPELFALEKYPTVWQMTSSAEVHTEASLESLFTALFPCASITGAPKYRTMDIIAALERRPRRLYTGTIGMIAPGRRARFSVAIRTAVIDKAEGIGEYGVGAGITWNSDAEEEYRECLQKARILERAMPPFSLLETLLWTPEKGYSLLQEHLERMASSAAYFDRPWDKDEILNALERCAAGLPAHPHKVRLLLNENGSPACQPSPLPARTEGPVRLGLARTPVDPGNPFLYHKTTFRDLYEQARNQRPDCDDVLLWNRRGEVTETCIANLVVERDGELVTPALDGGLLPGTFRQHLLAKGEIRESVLTREDLHHSNQLFVVNSVRGWQKAILIP